MTISEAQRKRKICKISVHQKVEYICKGVLYTNVVNKIINGHIQNSNNLKYQVNIHTKSKYETYVAANYRKL